MDRFNISLFHSMDRDSESWILSESDVSDKVAKGLVHGHHAVLDVSISEQALCVFPVTELPRREGRIREHVGFVPVSHLAVPMPVVLVNTPFLDMLEGESMFDKLAQLAPLTDISDAGVQALFATFAEKFGFHCVGVVV